MVDTTSPAPHGRPPTAWTPPRFTTKGPERHGGSERAEADALGAYLTAIRRTPLLTATEETALARRIEVGIVARRHLETGQYRLRRERRDLEHLAADGDRARRRFIEANLRLVVSVAMRHAGQASAGHDRLDLIADGNLGLIHAIELFDHRRGVKFSTYATPWIRQSVIRSIDDKSRTVRLPVHVHESIRSLAARLRDLGETGRDSASHAARLARAAAEAGIDVDRASQLEQLALPVLSLDAPPPFDIAFPLDGSAPRTDARIGRTATRASPPQTLGDLLPDPADGIGEAEDRIANAQRNVEIAKTLVRVLDRRARRILCLRFGLRGAAAVGALTPTDFRGGAAPLTLEETGHRLGITRERVRQLEAKALKTLREAWTDGVLAAPPRAAVRAPVRAPRPEVEPRADRRPTPRSSIAAYSRPEELRAG